jgi:hypothetical protein
MKLFAGCLSPVMALNGPLSVGKLSEDSEDCAIGTSNPADTPTADG